MCNSISVCNLISVSIPGLLSWRICLTLCVPPSCAWYSKPTSACCLLALHLARRSPTELCFVWSVFFTHAKISCSRFFHTFTLIAADIDANLAPQQQFLYSQTFFFFVNSALHRCLICRRPMYPRWPLRRCPCLGRSCVISSRPSCASWPLPSSTPAWWPWPPVSTSPAATGPSWFSSSTKASGGAGSPWKLCAVETEWVTDFLPLPCRGPQDWSAETMEELGPLLLLNDSAITALPDKVGESCVFKCSTD